MAMMNCPECGKSISDKAFSCPNCGYQLNNSTDIQYKRVIPGRGFAISSMVLGILGLVYGFVMMDIALTMSEYVTWRVAQQNMTLPTIFAVLALTFGFVAHSKGYKKGPKTAGIVLGAISLIICIISVIVVFQSGR